MKTASLLAVASISLLGLAACEPEVQAPAVPEPTAGAIADPNSLNGTYNLRQSGCTSDDAPETRLVIEGNKFNFYESACTVARSEGAPQSLKVTLACTGEGAEFNRNVSLQTRPGELRLTDDATTLTYFKCDA